MTYGVKVFKNGKRRGYLTFSTGKQIVLNSKETADFEDKIRYWQSTGRDTRYERRRRYGIGKAPAETRDMKGDAGYEGKRDGP